MRVLLMGMTSQDEFEFWSRHQLTDDVNDVVTNDAFRRRARELGQALTAAGGAPRAAELAEQALTTGRPVLRA